MIFTYVEGVQMSGLEWERARKASLVLRAAGYPVTGNGYMTEDSIANLIAYAEPAEAAYDAAEQALRMHERDRDNDPDDRFTLPQDSHITSSVIAHRAAQSLDLAANSVDAA